MKFAHPLTVSAVLSINAYRAMAAPMMADKGMADSNKPMMGGDTSAFTMAASAPLIARQEGEPLQVLPVEVVRALEQASPDAPAPDDKAQQVKQQVEEQIKQQVEQIKHPQEQEQESPEGPPSADAGDEKVQQVKQELEQQVKQQVEQIKHQQQPEQTTPVALNPSPKKSSSSKYSPSQQSNTYTKHPSPNPGRKKCSSSKCSSNYNPRQ